MGDINIYCHFSFRRKKEQGRSYGIFATAFYADENGKKLMGKDVRAFNLWEDHQFVTAIQAYEHAMYCIWSYQEEFISHGIARVILVSDNSTLVGWILNKDKNINYTYWMDKAESQYKAGNKKAISTDLDIGVMKAVKYEKSYKYCNLNNVQNKLPWDTSEKKKSALSVKGKNAMEIAVEVDNFEIAQISDEEFFV